ncbi:MAG: autotransporter outer membrane beta-barrel domain-containing protein [Candidatus Endonucleobacter bathymodioli]|uniref:Autotransporter outer membrane beta-barrel domain-containing protein n=1 Tax=Candidatus Endonucleibacter bathymodioli TaxID=539814 RepID=A0AA90P0L2_9GAMM|nr:autotransporter outer membrane beta-barrel domain-containing protein [Candidatus Endonucleobacter bathymodioli]
MKRVQEVKRFGVRLKYLSAAVVLGSVVGCVQASSTMSVAVDSTLIHAVHGNIEQRLNGRNAADAIIAGDSFESQGIWGRYIYSDGSQKQDDDKNAIAFRLNGFTLGLEGIVNEQLTVGFAFTYGKTDIDVKDGSAILRSQNGDNYLGTLYFGWTEGSWFVDTMLSYGEEENKYIYNQPLGNNPVNGAPLQYRNLKSDGKMKTWGMTIGGGYTIAISGKWALKPKSEFNFVSMRYDDRNMKTDAALAANDIRHKTKDIQIAEAGAGVSLLGNIGLGKVVFTSEFRVMGYYDLKDNKVEGEVIYIPSMTSLFGVVAGQKRDRGRAVMGLGLSCAVGGLSFGLDYDYSLSGDYKVHSVAAKASCVF